jgi:aryl-alcohol dehydrogenase-like predicted oxidoreductase
VSVQNHYSLVDRANDEVLNYCEREKISFIPYFPLAAGKVSGTASAIARDAAKLNITPSQLAIAWLLKRSPVMLPIPGTSQTTHLEENVAAAAVELDDATMKDLDRPS